MDGVGRRRRKESGRTRTDQSPRQQQQVQLRLDSGTVADTHIYKSGWWFELLVSLSLCAPPYTLPLAPPPLPPPSLPPSIPPLAAAADVSIFHPLLSRSAHAPRFSLLSNTRTHQTHPLNHKIPSLLPARRRRKIKSLRKK